MDKFDTAAWKLLAQLLEMAGQEFSNHGCNDFELDNTPENVKLLFSALEWNDPNGAPWGIQLNQEQTKLYTSDTLLIGYFEHLAKEMAGIE